MCKCTAFGGVSSCKRFNHHHLNNVAALVVSSIPLAYNEDWVRILHFEVYILKSTWNKDVRELEEEVT